MNNTLKIFIIAIASLSFAGNQKHAIDLSVGIGYSNVMYGPIFSTSYYWFRDIGNNELSVEYMSRTAKTSSEINEYSSMGCWYSLLFKMPIRYLFIGPTIGLSIFENIKKDQNNIYPYLPMNIENSYYIGGAKIALILGKNVIRFKIQNTILCGYFQSFFHCGFIPMDIVNTSLIYAF
jgi:hypothetical protein